MSNIDTQQTPDEQFQAFLNTTIKLEDGFLTAGQLLCEIKTRKTFRFKGYEKFKDFVENEFGISSAFANKLVGVYDEFVEEQTKDVNELREIGLEKLHLIKPLVRKQDWSVKEEWYQKALEMSLPDLKTAIKELKDAEKSDNLDMKDVLVDQWKERMTCLFNCSWKEVQFKLALWFLAHPSEFDDALKNEVRQLQLRFEQEVINNQGDAEKASVNMHDLFCEAAQKFMKDVPECSGIVVTGPGGETKITRDAPPFEEAQ